MPNQNGASPSPHIASSPLLRQTGHANDQIRERATEEAVARGQVPHWGDVPEQGREALRLPTTPDVPEPTPTPCCIVDGDETEKDGYDLTLEMSGGEVIAFVVKPQSGSVMLPGPGRIPAVRGWHRIAGLLLARVDSMIALMATSRGAR